MVNSWETHGLEIQLFENCVEKSSCVGFSGQSFTASDSRHGVSG